MRKFFIICIVIVLLIAGVLTGIWHGFSPGSQRIESSNLTDVLFYSATYDKRDGFGESVFVKTDVNMGDPIFPPHEKDDRRFGIVLAREPFSDDPDLHRYRYPAIHFSSPWLVCHSVPLDQTNAFLQGSNLWNHLDHYDRNTYDTEPLLRSDRILAKWANRDFFTSEKDRAFLRGKGFSLVPARRLPRVAKP